MHRKIYVQNHRGNSGHSSLRKLVKHRVHNNIFYERLVTYDIKKQTGIRELHDKSVFKTDNLAKCVEN
jgi:hypothetical protein